MNAMGYWLSACVWGPRREGRLRKNPQRMGGKFHWILLDTPHSEFSTQVAGTRGQSPRVGGVAVIVGRPRHRLQRHTWARTLHLSRKRLLPSQIRPRLQQCRPSRCRQSPAPSPLGSVSELSHMCIYIYASHVTALLCAARPLPLDWLGRSLRTIGFEDRNLRVRPTSGRFLSCKERRVNSWVGLVSHRAEPSGRTGGWVPSLCPRSGSSLRTPEPFAPSAPRS